MNTNNPGKKPKEITFFQYKESSQEEEHSISSPENPISDIFDKMSQDYDSQLALYSDDNGQLEMYYSHKLITGEKLAETKNNFTLFLHTLNNMSEYDVVLLSIGSVSFRNTEQQIPSFLNAFKKPNKILVINLDIRYLDTYILEKIIPKLSLIPEEEPNHFKSSNPELDLSFKIFSCYLPAENDPHQTYLNFFKEKIIDFLNQGKRFYIANHTQAFSLDDIPLIAELYNEIKRHFQDSPENAKLLQLYTQGGESVVITYYLDLLYDERSKIQFRSIGSKAYTSPLAIGEPLPFYLCRNFEELSQLTEFSPDNSIELVAESKSLG
jgi:hypothetical protein